MKRITKVIICYLLVVASLVSTIETTAQAADSDPSRETISNQQLTETEDALVNGYECLDENAFEAIDLYVIMDDSGLYHISNDAALRALLTEEQYKITVTQIEKVNTRTIVSANKKAESKGSAVGTEKNPYLLTPGVKVSITASMYWFTCTVVGATDFIVPSNSTVDVRVYKKTLFGKKQVLQYTTTSFNKTLSDCSINNGSNKYLISVQAYPTATFSCTVKQHVDSRNRTTGASWKPKSQSAIPSTTITYLRYWYVDKDRVGEVYQMISRSNYLDMVSAVANGSLSLTLFLTGLGFPTTAIYMGIASVLTSFYSPFNFKQAYINQLNNVAGYIGYINNKYTYSRGCVVIEFISNGTYGYTIQGWDGSTMYGPSGYTGTWTDNE